MLDTRDRWKARRIDEIVVENEKLKAENRNQYFEIIGIKAVVNDLSEENNRLKIENLALRAELNSLKSNS